MRSVVLALALIGGCKFEPGRFESRGDARSDDGAMDDASDAAPDSMPDSPPTPLCNAADPTLRACFTFDGDTLDGSSYGNDATASVSGFTTGHTGMAKVTTAGTLTVDNTTSLDVSALTIKAWINPATIPTGGNRAGIVDSASRWRLFLQSDGALRCAVTGGIDLTSVTGVVTAATWQRITCTYDGSLMRIYVNGTMVAQKTQTSTLPANGAGMVIGHDNPSGSNLVGAIDELQIFSAVVAP